MPYFSYTRLWEQGNKLRNSMEWAEIFRIIIAGLVSIGGAGAIILAISKYFGNILAKKYEQKLIAKFQNEINEHLSKLEIIKQTTLRYSNKQFEFYSILWASLQNLKISADNLWEIANSKNLFDFSKQLNTTKIEIEKASLFIEDEHYRELIQIIKHFNEFQIGKKRLIDYRRELYLEDDIIESRMIAKNQKVKERFDELIMLIKSHLKKQLKGE